MSRLSPDPSNAYEAARGPSVTYAEAVGAFLREYREKRGLTLDAVARAGRQHGAAWSATSIRNIETARASLTIPSLLILALALNRLTGETLTLSDLLGRAEFITLDSATKPVSRAWITRALEGEGQDAPTEWGYAGETPFTADSRSPCSTTSLAETRAAKKLGIAPRELQEWAGKLWNKSLEAESAARAGLNSTPQKRGRIARGLVEEIDRQRHLDCHK